MGMVTSKEATDKVNRLINKLEAIKESVAQTEKALELHNTKMKKDIAEEIVNINKKVDDVLTELRAAIPKFK